MTGIRVFLIDDSSAFLTAAAGFLANTPGIEVVGQSRSTAEAFAEVAAANPDVVLVTHGLPETTGLITALRLKALTHPPRVIVISDHTEPPYRILAEAVQADGFVVKRDFSAQAPTLIRDLMKRPARMVGASVDSADRTPPEIQFRQPQKLEGIGRFAGGIANDFNDLLTVINGYADLAVQGLQPDDPLYDKIQEVRRAGERAAALTRQLLAFSRRQVLLPVVLNLNAVVAGMEPLLRRVIGEDIALTLTAAEHLGRVQADPAQIEQAILTLAVHARDAMPDGGRLTLETANVELDQAYAERHPGVVPGPYVMLAMTDTGGGMDKATRERIFGPFFTTKEAGKSTGLSLSTVYGIVQQSGGSIEVESEVGQGTRFTICLPSVDEVANPLAPAWTLPPARGSETILVVEDDEALRKLATQIVAAAGYRVLTAAGGGEAMLLLERHSGPVHLLLTDVLMPGMTGPELLERLRTIRPTLKVLYMSGYTGAATAQLEGIEQGVRFIGKPFSPAELTRRIRDLLDQTV